MNSFRGMLHEGKLEKSRIAARYSTLTLKVKLVNVQFIFYSTCCRFLVISFRLTWEEEQKEETNEHHDCSSVLAMLARSVEFMCIRVFSVPSGNVTKPVGLIIPPLPNAGRGPGKHNRCSLMCAGFRFFFYFIVVISLVQQLIHPQTPRGVAVLEEANIVNLIIMIYLYLYMRECCGKCFPG